jgi:hypothetical protein
MTEVLEHLESHVSIIHEAGRILKVGGFLVLTTPNMSRIHSRFQFFMSGHHKLIQKKLTWDIRPEDLYSNHFNPVYFPLLHLLLFQGSMQIQNIFFTRFKWRHAIWLLLYPAYWCFLQISLLPKPRHREIAKKGLRDLKRWMVHPALPFSEQLGIVAKKIGV